MNRNGVFISYNRNDKEWLNEVKKSLTLLKVNFNLNVWHDSEIETGDQWAKEINQAIQQCKFAILLVSRHFLDSEFILKNEFPKILKATKEGVRIFSIIIDHCAYEMLELKEYQFLNDPR